MDSLRGASSFLGEMCLFWGAILPTPTPLLRLTSCASSVPLKQHFPRLRCATQHGQG